MQTVIIVWYINCENILMETKNSKCFLINADHKEKSKQRTTSV